MLSKGMIIFIILLVIFTVLFILSVFAPKDSKSRFWLTIQKIRAAMDAISYYFLTACLIGTGIFIVGYFIKTKLI